MRIRRVARAALVLALATALVGCGEDDPDSSSSTPASSPSRSAEAEVKVLSAQEVKDAMLTLDDLGSDYKIDPDDDDDDDDDDGEFGCLTDFEDIGDNKDLDASAEAEAQYEAVGELGLPGVFTTIGTFESADEIEDAMQALTDAVRGCDEVDTTDEDGFRIRLDIDVDEKKSGSDATAQVNVTGVGTGSGDGIRFPFAMRISLIQVENNLVLVGFVTASEDVDEAADAVNARALARLAAAAAGEDQPDLEPLDLPVIDVQELFGGGGSSAA